MATSIAVVNYGTGNLRSVYKKLAELNATPILATSARHVEGADKIVLPGVGHFAASIIHLKKTGMYDCLNEAVLINRKPVLGICLGMELLAQTSEEGHVDGFGWLKAAVVKFRINELTKYKVPQIGWNTVDLCKKSPLFKNIEDHAEFYFLHSYHFDGGADGHALAKTSYEYDFVSAVEKENIFGTQFHPEKSHKAGDELLRNFIRV